jgi:tol-pal system-associated acyl-CoA thioesterase
VLALTFRIYLEDTDAGGVVYHTSYLRLMERARTEFLRQAGLEQSATFLEDVSFVVHEMTVRFSSPARLDDEVRVTCRVAQVRGASFLLEQRVDGDRGRTLHCEARVSVACIRLSNKKPRRLPEQLLRHVREGGDRVGKAT